MTKDYRALARELFDALKMIDRDFKTAEEVQRDCDRPGKPEYGLRADEAVEYAYDNVRMVARQAIEGKRRP